MLQYPEGTPGPSGHPNSLTVSTNLLNGPGDVLYANYTQYDAGIQGTAQMANLIVPRSLTTSFFYDRSQAAQDGDLYVRCVPTLSAIYNLMGYFVYGAYFTGGWTAAAGINPTFHFDNFGPPGTTLVSGTSTAPLNLTPGLVALGARALVYATYLGPGITAFSARLHLGSQGTAQGLLTGVLSIYAGIVVLLPDTPGPDYQAAPVTTSLVYG